MADVTIAEFRDGDRSNETEIADSGISGDARIQNRHRLNLLPAELDFIARDGTHYALDCANIVGMGGEGCVVVARDDAGKGFVAKISFIQPQYRTDNEDILQRLTERTTADPDSFRQDHLMPTYAWGTVFARPVGYEHDTELLVTVMPKCRPLADESLSPSYVKGTVLPHLAEALKTLHDMNIVHRDVKPANVYELDGAVVLGDFGISCPLEEGQDIHDTRTDRRTVGYTPRQNAVMKENDWYSLGYTLWTMYNGGAHPYQSAIDEYSRTGTSDALARAEQGFRDIRFSPREAGDETFGQLVFGLTALSAPNRLGYDDVQRYLGNPAAFRYEDTGAVTVQARKPYTFEGVDCYDDRQLAGELASKWDRAKRHLYAGNLEKYYRDNDNYDLSAALNEIVERDPETVRNQDLGLAKAIWLISGKHRMLYWKGVDISLPTLIMLFKEERLNRLVSYGEPISSGILSWSLAQLDDEGGRKASEVMRLVERAGVSSPYYANCFFQQLFAEGGRSVWAGATDFETHAKRVFGTPYDLYRIVEAERVLDEALASFAPVALKSGKADLLAAGREKVSGQDKVSTPVRVERLLTLLDDVAKGSPYVRSLAVDYGPKGGWLWTAAHTDLYECNDDESRTILADLAKEVPSASDNVAAILNHGENARHLCNRFFRMMDATPLPEYLGYPTGVQVKAKTVEAMPCSSFYGDPVPRGFARALLLATPEAKRGEWSQVKLLSDGCRNAAASDTAFSVACEPWVSSCDYAVSASGSLIGPMVNLAVSGVALGVLVPFMLSGAPYGHAISTVGKMLATNGFDTVFGILDVPTLAVFGALVFLLLELFIAIRNLVTSSVSRSAAARCEALRDQGNGEVAAFAAGSSRLTALIEDVDWDGKIDSVDCFGQIKRLTNAAAGLEGYTETTWYKVLWHVTSFLPAELLFFFLLSFRDVWSFFAGTSEYSSSLDALLLNEASNMAPGVATFLFFSLVVYGIATFILVRRFGRNCITWIVLVVLPALLFAALSLFMISIS